MRASSNFKVRKLSSDSKSVPRLRERRNLKYKPQVLQLHDSFPKRQVVLVAFGERPRSRVGRVLPVFSKQSEDLSSCCSSSPRCPLVTLHTRRCQWLHLQGICPMQKIQSRLKFGTWNLGFGGMSVNTFRWETMAAHMDILRQTTMTNLELFPSSPFVVCFSFTNILQS